MKTIADYAVLHDGAFALDDSPGNPGDVRKIDFHLPSDFVHGANLAQPVLQFITHLTSNSGDVAFWINPPNAELLQSTRDFFVKWTNTSFHFDIPMWEAVQGGKFNAGASNSLFFRVNGKTHIRGVILWCQRRL